MTAQLRVYIHDVSAKIGSFMATSGKKVISYHPRLKGNDESVTVFPDSGGLLMQHGGLFTDFVEFLGQFVDISQTDDIVVQSLSDTGDILLEEVEAELKGRCSRKSFVTHS